MELNRLLSTKKEIEQICETIENLQTRQAKLWRFLEINCTHPIEHRYDVKLPKIHRVHYCNICGKSM